MTAEIIDFQKYRDRKLRAREMAKPIPEADIQQRRQSQKMIGEPGEPGGDGGKDSPQDGDTV